ncbi:MAG TPA: hypothetical protein VGC41_07075 [Kofleriaceae bacterium]
MLSFQRLRVYQRSMEAAAAIDTMVVMKLLEPGQCLGAYDDLEAIVGMLTKMT